MSDNLTELLRKYSTEPEDMEKLLKELHAGLEQRKVAKPEVSVLNTPQIFDWEEARGMGIPVRQGWMLKLTPDTSERGYSFSMITPEKWEITEDWKYISPEGKQYGYEEMEDVVGEHPETVYGVTKDRTEEAELVAITSYLERDPEGFMADLMEAGRTSESENLLKQLGASEQFVDYLFMSEEERATFLANIYTQGQTPETEAILTDLGVENIEEFFSAPSTIEAAKQALGEAEWIQKPSLAIYEDQPWYMKYTPLALFLAPGIISPKAQAGLGVGIAYFEKYVQMPYETYMLGKELITTEARGTWGEYNKETYAAMDKVFEKYGYGAYFSDEMHEIVEGYKAHETVKEQFLRGQLPMEIAEWLNPVYLIPVGGGVGWGARLLSKVPVIGKVARYTAAGVQAAERGVMYPITKPVELGAKGFEKLGVKIGEKYANRLINESSHLTDMAVPATREIESELFANNWMKSITKTLAKAPVIGPGVKWGVIKTLGPRELIGLESRAVEDVVGRQAVVWLEIRKRGMAAASAKIWELRAISLNPTKLFGFDENAISRTIPRLSERATGTLEDIFTHPELYRLTENQLAYVTRLHELNTQVLNFLKNEGVAPRVMTEDWWVHRVVVGKFDAEGELRKAWYERVCFRE